MSDRLNQWDNGTVLVESWDDGSVLIKERADRYATWGPPRVLRGARPGPLTPQELGTLLAVINHGAPLLDDPEIAVLQSAGEKIRRLHGLPTGPAE